MPEALRMFPVNGQAKIIDGSSWCCSIARLAEWGERLEERIKRLKTSAQDRLYCEEIVCSKELCSALTARESRDQLRRSLKHNSEELTLGEVCTDCAREL